LVFAAGNFISRFKTVLFADTAVAANPFFADIERHGKQFLANVFRIHFMIQITTFAVLARSEVTTPPPNEEFWHGMRLPNQLYSPDEGKTTVDSP
jgi:hypothetical protein